MPTKKAPFKGDGAWSKIKDFSDNLRQTLKEFYPSENGQDPIFVDPEDGTLADEFVEVMLSEASFALEELHWMKFDILKEEIRNEREDLLKYLKNTHRCLVSLSPGFDRLLGIDANPLGCADEIQKLINHVEQSEHRINKLPRNKKTRDKQFDISLELAIRVLRVAHDYGIPISSADHPDGRASTSTLILQAIGDDIGLCKHVRTWSKTVAKAKKLAPNLN